MFNWVPSIVNYDTISTGYCSSMRMLMNQQIEANKASFMSSMVPQYSFGSFIPYGEYNDINCLLDFNYTSNMWDWQQKNKSFNNFWSNPYFGCGYQSTASTVRTPGSSETDPEGKTLTDEQKEAQAKEERKFQAKYNILLSLVKQIIASNNNGITEDEKLDLEYLVQNPTGNFKDKYEKLEAKYKEIFKDNKKDVVREILVKNGVGLTVNGNADEDFYSRLKGTGYEYSKTEADDIVKDLYKGINNTKDSNFADDTVKKSIEALVKFDNVNILDFISSWNTSDNNIDLIQFLTNKYSNLNDNKDFLYNNVIKEIVNKLLDESDTIENDNLKNAREALRTALKNKNLTEINTQFKNLYLLTRLAKVDELENDVVDYYGKIDAELFKDDIFTAGTEKDLKDEGFSEEAIKQARATLAGTKDETDVPPAGKEGPVAPGGKTDDKNVANVAADAEANANKKANKELGKELAIDLIGFTNEGEQENILDIINNKMNEENVFDILSGYYAEDGSKNSGIIEQLMSEYADLEKDGVKYNVYCAKAIVQKAVNNLTKQAEKETDTSKKGEILADIQLLNEHLKKGNTTWTGKGNFWHNWFGKDSFVEKIDDILKKYYDKETPAAVATTAERIVAPTTDNLIFMQAGRPMYI